MVSIDTEDFKVTSVPLVFLPLPDFVVIRMTPLDAREPYNAAADEPFNTLIVAISFGSRLAIPLE